MLEKTKIVILSQSEHLDVRKDYMDELLALN